MRHRLSTQAGILAAGAAAGQLANSLVAIFVARFLSLHDFGTFRQVYLVFGTLTLLADVGFCESLYHFIPRQLEKYSAYLFRAVFFTGIVQVMVGLVLLASRESIGRFFNNPDLPPLIGFLVVALGMTVITRLWEVQFIAQQRILAAAVVGGGYEVLKAVLMLGCLVIAPSVRGLLWALVGAAVLKFVAFAGYMAKKIQWTPNSFVDGDAATHFRYAMAFGLQASFSFFATQAHQYIVGYFSTAEVYGLYSVACFQVPFVSALVNSIRQVLLVENTGSLTHGRYEQVRQIWRDTCRQCLLIMVPTAVCLSVLARPLISVLFTTRYANAAPVFAILVMMLPLNVIFTDNALRTYGQIRSFTSFHASRLILLLVLGIFGIRYFGIWGVAVSTVLSLAIVKVGQLSLTAKLFRVTYKEVLPWAEIGKILAAAVIAGAAASVCLFSNVSSGLTLIIGFPLYIAVYVASAHRLSLITDEDIQQISSNLRSLFSNFLESARLREV